MKDSSVYIRNLQKKWIGIKLIVIDQITGAKVEIIYIMTSDLDN